MNPMRGRGWREAIRQFLGRRRGGPGGSWLELGLELDETWSTVVGRRGVEVRCDLGLLMITCEGDPEDHVLPVGETFVARRPGRLAIWAFRPARLRVSTAGEAVRDGGKERGQALPAAGRSARTG